MGEWCRVMTSNGWRVFPTSLAGPYLGKSLGVVIPEPTAKAFIDNRGMMMVDRTVQTLELDGLTIEIPSQDFSDFCYQLKFARSEHLDDQTVVWKLRGWLCGLVLTGMLRHALLDLMEDRLPAVELIAQEENAEFLRRVDSMGGRVVSARAETIRRDGPGDKKPN